MATAPISISNHITVFLVQTLSSAPARIVQLLVKSPTDQLFPKQQNFKLVHLDSICR